MSYQKGYTACKCSSWRLLELKLQRETVHVIQKGPPRRIFMTHVSMSTRLCQSILAALLVRHTSWLLEISGYKKP